MWMTCLGHFHSNVIQSEGIVYASGQRVRWSRRQVKERC